MEKYNAMKDWDIAQEKLKSLGERKLPTGWSVWDDWFGGFVKGTLQLVAAPTGHGKTTFLLAMAKKAVRQGYKVLYIGTEQPAEIIIARLGEPLDIDVCYKVSNDTLSDCIGDDTYDIIIYDYLGAEASAIVGKEEWRVLRDQADELSNYAIERNTCILTAAQADVGALAMKPGSSPNDCIPNNGSAVSFAKHIVDKISAGAYLVKLYEGCVAMKVMKNRYGKSDDNVRLIRLDYENTEVN